MVKVIAKKFILYRHNEKELQWMKIMSGEAGSRGTIEGTTEGDGSKITAVRVQIKQITRTIYLDEEIS